MNVQHKQFQHMLLQALPAMRRYCLSLTGHVQNAEDLLQATVERALSRWHQYQPGTHFDRWLFRLCRNLWIDTMRQEKPTDNFDDVQESLLCANSGEAQTDARLTLEIVQQHMQNLSEVLRTTLYLIAVEGRSYQETADIMEVPIGTIMSRLSRARQQLSSALA